MGELFRKSLKTLAMFILMGVSLNAFGQAQMSDVAETFNQGVQLMKINPDGAITAFENAIKLADEVGNDEAMEIKGQAVKQIPKMYYESAKKLAGKKDYKNAIAKLEKSAETAETSGDKAQISKANRTILSILNSQGGTAFKNGEYDAALGYYDNAIQRKSTYAKAFLGKTLVYDKIGDLDKMEETALLGMEAAKKGRDNKTAGSIQKKLRSTFFNSAQAKFQNNDFAGAEKCLSRSIEYGSNNALTYYQMGLAFEGQKKWAESIESFSKSVELDMGSDNEKAKIFFKLAGAYEAMGNGDKACENYKLSLYGEFAEAAKYKIETVLKCSELKD